MEEIYIYTIPMPCASIEDCESEERVFITDFPIVRGTLSGHMDRVWISFSSYADCRAASFIYMSRVAVFGGLSLRYQCKAWSRMRLGCGRNARIDYQDRTGGKKTPRRSNYALEKSFDVLVHAHMNPHVPSRKFM